MNWFVCHVVSGESLFSGSAMIVSGQVAATFARAGSRRLAGPLGKSFVFVGATLIWLSSTPTPLWLSVLLGFSLVLWIVLECVTSVAENLRRLGRLAVALTCASLVVVELPHSRMARLPRDGYNRLYVVGDSLSAGMDQGQASWPSLLQKHSQARVVNLAKPGATLSSGLRQAQQIPDEPCLVLVELGGNDLLGKAAATEFRDDLEKLLAALQRPDRTLVMFELPLLPGRTSIGRVQRSVAATHSVCLIPKRYLARVLCSREATIDGLHLSDSGAAAMAELVNELIGTRLVHR